MKLLSLSIAVIAALTILSLALFSQAATPTPDANDPLAPAADLKQVILRPPTDDAFGDQLAADQNFGRDKTLDVARYLSKEQYYHRLSVVRFDLSPIPSGATIEQANLRLQLTGAAGLANVDVGLGGAYGPEWSEDTVTFNYPGVQCTAIINKISVDDKGPYPKLFSWDATAFVKAWIEQGYANLGLCVRGPLSGEVYYRGFSSKEGDYDPELVVSYYDPTPTSTPTPSPTPTRTPTPSSCGDAHEPNDSASAAWPIAPGTDLVSYICSPEDSDWFSFTVAGPVEIHARLDGLPASYELTLYTPAGAVAARGVGSGTDPRELTYMPLTGGSYLLRVGPSSAADWSAAKAYRLRADLPALSPISLRAVADTYVNELAPDANYGDERQISVSEDEFGYQRHGLFRFDLSDVPAVTISSAYLRLSLFNEASHEYDLAVRRVSAAWDEDTVTWNTKPWSVDTGLHASVGGALSRYYQWDVTSLVQSWLTGGVGNLGLELQPAVGASVDSRSFRSSEYAAGAFALPGTGSARTPRLVIHFSAPDPGELGSLGGRLYVDVDANHRFSAGDDAVSGVRVELFRDRIIQGREMTGADGAYTFTGLSSGEYELVVSESSLPAEYTLAGGGTTIRWLPAGVAEEGVDFWLTYTPPPDPVPDPTLDLRPRGMEFIQVVHDGELIEGKRTLVRVFIEADGVTNPVENVNGILWRDGHDTDVIEAVNRNSVAIHPGENPETSAAVIHDLDRTLNFVLPVDWANDDTFVVQVNIDRRLIVSAPERPGAQVNNQIRETRNFYPTDTLTLQVVRLMTPDGMTTETEGHFTAWLRKTFPLSDVELIPDYWPTTVDFGDTSGPGCGNAWNRILLELGSRWFFSFHWGRYFTGMVPYNAISWPSAGSVTVGCGNNPGHASAAVVTAGSDDGGRWMAHEIGHNLDRDHTDSPAGGEDDPDESYPYDDGLIGVYGVDLGNPAAPAYISPAEHYDLMSYSDPQWLSDFTFDGLYAQVRAEAAGRQVAASSTEAQREYLVASGFIDQLTPSTITPFYRVMLPTGASDEVGYGAFALQLQDASGNALFTRYFDLAITHTGDPSTGSFFEIVPWQVGAARVVIRRGQDEIYAVAVSSHVPEVVVTSPNGGESWLPYGEHTLTWSASDADGDLLHYTVQYSTDGGTTWNAIATDLDEQSYTVDAGVLAGSATARLRVIVTDGVNTAQDDSDGIFSVEGKPPIATIASPVDTSRHLPGLPVILEGVATDLEDGAITDGLAFRWHSSLEGDLGLGRQLFFEDLLPGRHIITLEVTDSDRFVSSDAVTIIVGHPLFVPMVQRN